MIIFCVYKCANLFTVHALEKVQSSCGRLESIQAELNLSNNSSVSPYFRTSLAFYYLPSAFRFNSLHLRTLTELSPHCMLAVGKSCGWNPSFPLRLSHKKRKGEGESKLPTSFSRNDRLNQRLHHFSKLIVGLGKNLSCVPASERFHSLCFNQIRELAHTGVRSASG